MTFWDTILIISWLSFDVLTESNWKSTGFNALSHKDTVIPLVKGHLSFSNYTLIVSLLRLLSIKYRYGTKMLQTKYLNFKLMSKSQNFAYLKIL